jgi:hypothetical protein
MTIVKCNACGDTYSNAQLSQCPHERAENPTAVAVLWPLCAATQEEDDCPLRAGPVTVALDKKGKTDDE